MFMLFILDGSRYCRSRRGNVNSGNVEVWALDGTMRAVRHDRRVRRAPTVPVSDHWHRPLVGNDNSTFGENRVLRAVDVTPSQVLCQERLELVAEAKIIALVVVVAGLRVGVGVEANDLSSSKRPGEELGVRAQLVARAIGDGCVATPAGLEPRHGFSDVVHRSYGLRR